MKFKRKKCPFSIGLLAIIMIAISLWAISNRLQFLYFNHTSFPVVADTDQITINLDLISGMSALCLSFIPLAFGIGLLYMLHWARVLSICLFGSVMLPSFLAAMSWIPDGDVSDQTNWIITGICAIALLVLLNPKISNLFSTQRSVTSDWD